MARLFLCFNPYEPTPVRAPLLTDWLELALGGQQECVNKMVDMVSDLSKQGVDSRFIKWFVGGVGELKSRTRVGGDHARQVHLMVKKGAGVFLSGCRRWVCAGSSRMQERIGGRSTAGGLDV